MHPCLMHAQPFVPAICHALGLHMRARVWRAKKTFFSCAEGCKEHVQSSADPCGLIPVGPAELTQVVVSKALQQNILGP